MLATILVTFFVMLFAVTAMSVGVIARNRPIKGSCGGMSAEDGFDCACARAGKPPQACEPAASRD